MASDIPRQPPAAGPHLRRLAESDWRVFAELRLQALADGTDSRQAGRGEESSFTAAQWRRRLRTHAQFAAYDGDHAVGLIGAQRERVDSVYLYSLWLEPRSRGRGLGRALLAAAIEWARTQGARTVTLRVAPTNAAARRVYEQSGFHVVPTTSAEATGEVTMSMAVD